MGANQGLALWARILYLCRLILVILRKSSLANLMM